MERFKHSFRGFTLIELLVVISILGLISSVALANLQDAKDKAKIAAGKQFHASLDNVIGSETVAKWEFDEGTGNSATDSSGNGRTGTIVGATYVPGGVTGSALAFDGHSYITGTDFPNPGNNGKMTIVAWVKPSNIAAHNTIFNASGANCSAVQTSIVGGVAHSASGSAPPGVATPDSFVTETTVGTDRILNNNVWQDLAFVYDNGVVTTYVNGAKKDSIGGVGTANCPDAAWVVGADSNLGDGFQGLMDSVHVYGAALSASEIGKIYAEGPRPKEALVIR